MNRIHALILFFLIASMTPASLFSAEAGERIRINGNLADTGSRRTLASVTEQGTVEQLFDIQKKLVGKLLKEMNIDRERLPEETREALAKPHTTHFEAFVAYSVGLDLTDRGQYREARAAFRRAARLDPTFLEARRQERLTPFKRQSIAELSKRLVSQAQRQRFRPTPKKIKKRKKTSFKPPPTPRPPPPPAPTKTPAGPGDEKKGDDPPQPAAKPESFENTFDRALGDTLRLTDGVAGLTKKLAANPGNGPALFKKALANRMDADIALETVLSEMRGVDKNTLKQVLDSALDSGLNPEQARRVVKRLRATGGCR